MSYPEKVMSGTCPRDTRAQGGGRGAVQAVKIAQ